MSVSTDPTLRSIEVDLLLEGIFRRYGYDFRQYSRPSLIRRIERGLEREGLQRTTQLLDLVINDNVAMNRFVEAITVHTTSMFRDPDVYAGIRGKVVPLLRTYPFARIWVAGCSSGEEVYSLAIVLHEAGLLERVRIYATDISDTILDKARQGVLSLSHMRDSTQAYIQAGGKEEFSQYYLADASHAIFRSHLRRNVIFSQHNLATDQTFNEFQLIMCRNVNIYFTEELQRRVFTLMHESLAALGVLVLGRKESLRGVSHAEEYEEMVPSLRIFRKKGK